MTLTKNVSPTLSSPRRVRAGLILATLLLGGTLTACGDDAGSTTCGEYTGYSEDEKVDFVKDAAEDELDDDEIDQLEALGDDGYKSLAQVFTTACDGEDDDTQLDDIDGLN